MTKTTTAEPELFAPEKSAGKQKATAKKNKKPEAAPAAKLPARAEAKPPAIAEPNNLYSAIIAAAANPAVDVAKMKALVDLQITVEDREAKRAFTRAFNALQFELPVIDKDGFIDHGDGQTARGNAKMKARYSTYPNLMAVCRPLLKKHGFTFNNVIEPSVDGTKTDVVGYLVHVDGHQMRSPWPLDKDVSGKKQGPQQTGSGASYAKRYNLILMLDIVSEAPQDKDIDGARQQEKPDVISHAEVQELTLCLEDAGVDAAVFCEKYQIDALPDLPKKLFTEAKKALADYKARVAAERANPKAGNDAKA